MKNTKKINKIIAMGRTKFILLYGMLFWGVSTAVIVSLIEYFTGQAFSLLKLAIKLITFPIVGIGWGYAMWVYFQKQHEQNKTAEPGNREVRETPVKI
jgi:hypothetical protein